MIHSFLSSIKTYLMLIMCICQAYIASGQASGVIRCASDEHWLRQLKEDPTLARQKVQLESMWATYSPPVHKNGDSGLRIIPVVFHIIHTYGSENIAKSYVDDQIKTLNENYSLTNKDTQYIRAPFKNLKGNVRVKFMLARRDPNGNCTEGIDRVYSTLTNNAYENVKSLVVWDTRKYLNIWVVSSILEFTGTGGTILGYAQFPWNSNGSTDGVVVRSDQIYKGNATLTHEIGHYLGLLHTFDTSNGAECDNNCRTAGDGICDTPPTGQPNYGCPTSVNSCHSDVPDLPDMIENYMDYSNCQHLFTLGQVDRINFYLTNTKRNQLATVSNLTATGVYDTTGVCKPKADFSPLQYLVCENNTVSFTNSSYNASVINYNWTFEGGTPATSTVKSPVITYSKAGTYTVKLKAYNSTGADSLTRSAIITVKPAVSEVKSPILEDFENFSNTEPGWSFSKDANSLRWVVSSAAGQSGNKSIYLKNTSATQDQFYTFDLPAIDMSASSNSHLKFYIAYGQISDLSKDEFRLQVSQNCGQGFVNLYFKSGKNLSTHTGYVTSTFVPATADWRLIDIDMSNYKNTKNLIMRFSIKAGAGSNVYIDDINVGNFTSGIQPVTLQDAGISLYPNPAGSILNIENKSGSENISLIVSDLAGRTLKVLNISRSGEGIISLSRSELNISSSGMYYLKLIINGQTYVEKVIFQ